MTESLSAIRKRAWETRRAKYGPRGHCGSYSRPDASMRYKAALEENRRRFDACDDEPRLFIRRLRAILEWNDGDPEFELSEGMATSLLAERERRAVDRALRPIKTKVHA